MRQAWSDIRKGWTLFSIDSLYQWLRMLYFVGYIQAPALGLVSLLSVYCDRVG